MGDLCKHELGDWEKDCGYFKKCPVCGDTFWGRKNRIYCDEKCKQKVAIDILSEKNRKYGRNARQYIRNAKILEFFYPGANDLTPVPISEVIDKGFVDSGLHKKAKYEKFEGEWHLIGNYAYRLDDSRQKVLIIKSYDYG